MASPETDLVDTATSLVERLRKLGADTAEVAASSGWELSTKIRLGETELLEEAGHRHVSVRAILDNRVALTSTSDLTAAGLERCVNDAMELLKLSEPDPDAAPADPTSLARGPFPELDLFDETIEHLEPQFALELAKRAESAAFAFDARIKNSDGATFGRTLGYSALVLSSGFVGTKRGTQISLVATPVVEDADQKRRRGHYYSVARHLADLETAEFVGQEAARRTIAQLGARSVKTCEAPIIFSADAGRAIISAFIGCVLGGSLWRKASYLCGREGTSVASPFVTLIDDPFLPRGFGSRAFDGEGLPCRKNVVVKEGTYVTPLLDSLGARKLHRTSTGSAARHGGSISASTTNLIMTPGEQSEDELVQATTRALYVTDMMGFGFNAVTGDFSRGASGFWIENGERIHPVSEVTISSNLDRMLRGINAVATMGQARSSLLIPAFRLDAMTIAGA
jgi:PmbA protein